MLKTTLVGLLFVAHVATTSNIFCSPEFAAAVVRACIRTARSLNAKISTSNYGNTLFSYAVGIFFRCENLRNKAFCNPGPRIENYNA